MNYLAVFLFMVCADYIWAKCVTHTAKRHRTQGALWAGALIAAQAAVTVAYVGDHGLILPAIAGAFMGTFLGIGRRDAHAG